ncbi:hypothetical protein ACVWYF_003630 [Hymenobacter sp. UYAg731]
MPQDEPAGRSDNLFIPLFFFLISAPWPKACWRGGAVRQIATTPIEALAGCYRTPKPK